MILTKSGRETWAQAAMRFAKLEGVDRKLVNDRYLANVEEGFNEQRAAYLACAVFGIVDGVA